MAQTGTRLLHRDPLKSALREDDQHPVFMLSYFKLERLNCVMIKKTSVWHVQGLMGESEAQSLRRSLVFPRGLGLLPNLSVLREWVPWLLSILLQFLLCL